MIDYVYDTTTLIYPVVFPYSLGRLLSVKRCPLKKVALRPAQPFKIGWDRGQKELGAQRALLTNFKVVPEKASRR